MTIKYSQTKDLKGNTYLLDEKYPDIIQTEKHNPEVLIIPFCAFGIGTRLTFEKIKNATEINVEEYINFRYTEYSAVITNFYQEGDKFIIEAENNTKKEKKLEFVNKIIGKIDMNDTLSNDFFIDMLSNVFTEKQLQNFLNQDDIEILLFNNLMYIKSENKAYRL